MDNIPGNIGSTNTPLPLLQDDDDSSTDSSVSVSGGNVRLNDRIESAATTEPPAPELPTPAPYIPSKGSGQRHWGHDFD